MLCFAASSLIAFSNIPVSELSVSIADWRSKTFIASENRKDTARFRLLSPSHLVPLLDKVEITLKTSLSDKENHSCLVRLFLYLACRCVSTLFASSILYAHSIFTVIGDAPFTAAALLFTSEAIPIFTSPLSALRRYTNVELLRIFNAPSIPTIPFSHNQSVQHCYEGFARLGTNALDELMCIRPYLYRLWFHVVILLPLHQNSKHHGEFAHLNFGGDG